MGGNAASRPQLAQELTKDLSDNEALNLADRVMEFFKENGKKSERLGRTIDRVGFDTFKEAVLT